jgi:hypothetical protein
MFGKFFQSKKNVVIWYFVCVYVNCKYLKTKNCYFKSFLRSLILEWSFFSRSIQRFFNNLNNWQDEYLIGLLDLEKIFFVTQRSIVIPFLFRICVGINRTLFALNCGFYLFGLLYEPK